jgi:hypothetical protein
MEEAPSIIATAVGGILLVALTLAGALFFPSHSSLEAGVGAIAGCAINMVIQFALLPRLNRVAAAHRAATMHRIYWPSRH